MLIYVFILKNNTGKCLRKTRRMNAAGSVSHGSNAADIQNTREPENLSFLCLIFQSIGNDIVSPFRILTRTTCGNDNILFAGFWRNIGHRAALAADRQT